ncbi:unnamed protein product [Allacma fusca]|uniref:BSD domain-containing protein n=1 Tax=Allacma fusca TaxID=39272 RepID=A0A8J2PYK1_9HEXA|nr:unnamed protein product [Allacma fusca]
MLSGLTSQWGNFIAKKTATADNGAGAVPEQQSAQPSETPPAPAPTTADVNQDQGSAVTADASNANPANILSSVRNHMPSFSSWLGGAKKPEEEGAPSASPPPSAGPTATSPKDKVKGEEDDSSATGGADSDEQQVSEEEAAAAAAGATGAAAAGLDKVKNLGSFLFSSIKGAGQKIKETSILGEFQREHDSFLKSKSKQSDNALAPWVGHPKEDELKDEIMSLSNDRRNFVRSPPQGVNFAWDWNDAAPIAKAMLKDDPKLETMRYQLVPKVITEENFWRNYFYRVQLLKESMDDSIPKKRRGSSSEEDGDGEDADLEKELNEELKSFEVVGGDSKHDEKEIDSLLDLK